MIKADRANNRSMNSSPDSTPSINTPLPIQLLEFIKQHKVEIIAFILVVLLSGFLRFQYVSKVIVDTPIRADARTYVLHSWNLVKHGVFSGETTADPAPDDHVPPLYPIILAPFISSAKTTNDLVQNILLMNAWLSLLTVVLFYFLVRMEWGKIPAVVSGLLLGAAPHIISMAGYILSETPYILLIVMLFAAIRISFKFDRWPVYFITGLLSAMCLMIRPVFLLTVPAIFLVYALDHSRQQRKVVTALGAFALGFALLYSPWVIRNMNLPGSTGNGSSSTVNVTLGMGLYPDLTYKNPRLKGYPYRDDPRWEEITSSYGSIIDEFSRRLAEDPLEYLWWYTYGKVRMLWSWDIQVGQGDIYVYPVVYTPYKDSVLLKSTYRVWKILYIPLILLSLGSIIIYFWRKTYRQPDQLMNYVYAFLLSTTVLHMVTVGLPRHSIPLRPFLIFTAMWTLVTLSSRWKPAGNINNAGAPEQLSEQTKSGAGKKRKKRG
ncbi:MAG: glycosyltransferase family 39 protein [bacterium]|nr:glycosyltransferase family 39 protein [bacterium]